MNKDECCPEFDPEKWEEKTFDWDDKPFIKETIPTFFHIPFPPMIGRKVVKMCKLAEESNSSFSNPQDVLLLFADPHSFKSEIYLSVTKKVAGANNVQLSGTYISKVFDGPYNSVPKFIKKMDEYLSDQKESAKEYYVHYAYCPKCSKKFGHNFMILFAKVE